MVTRQDLVDNGYEDVLLIEGDYTLSALVGISSDRRAVYDYNLLVESFMEGNNWSEEEAVEWIENNVICVHFEEGNEPIYITENFVNYNFKDSKELIW